MLFENIQIPLSRLLVSSLFVVCIISRRAECFVCVPWTSFWYWLVFGVPWSLYVTCVTCPLLGDPHAKDVCLGSWSSVFHLVLSLGCLVCFLTFWYYCFCKLYLHIVIIPCPFVPYQFCVWSVIHNKKKEKEACCYAMQIKFVSRYLRHFKAMSSFVKVKLRCYYIGKKGLFFLLPWSSLENNVY